MQIQLVFPLKPKTYAPIRLIWSIEDVNSISLSSKLSNADTNSPDLSATRDFFFET